MKHGVIPGEDGTPTFWWLDQEMDLEEFNHTIIMISKAVGDEFTGVALGMEMAQKLDEGKLTVAQLEVLEEVLKLPLCDSCRRVIGG